MRFRVLLLAMVLGVLTPAALPSVALAKEGQPQPPKDFEAVDESQPGEQIPAMPLIGAAYGFIWIGVFGYVWSLGRRLQRVETEITELESKRK